MKKNEIKEGFNEFVAEYRAELKVTVTSATPLSKDVLSQLELALKQSQTAKATKVLTITNNPFSQDHIGC